VSGLCLVTGECCQYSTECSQGGCIKARGTLAAQVEFDRKYISSTELCKELGVTRATLVNGRRRGALPEPVRINRPNGDAHVMLWLRDEVKPYVDTWKVELIAGRMAA
jgi:hypothetical protein